MSMGNPILSCRIDRLLVEDVELQIESLNLHTRGEMWTVARFVSAAIAEKLLKMKRSRRKRWVAAKQLVEAAVLVAG